MIQSLLNLILKEATFGQLQLGIVFIRFLLGIIMMLHGIPKVMGGVPKWQWLGNTMQNFGIYFWPVAWGLLAACVETFGGFAFAIGMGTRLFAFLLALQMLVALIYHLSKGDDFTSYSHALSLLIVFIGFVAIGGGYYSVDSYLRKNLISSRSYDQ